MIASLLTVALATTLGGPGTPVKAAFGPPSEDERAAELLEEAVGLFKEEKFAEAARAFRKAFAIEPSPKYLYAWAQAERESGNCEAAIDLYQQFIEGGASGGGLKAAEENIERCEAKIEADAQAAEEARARDEAERQALERAAAAAQKPVDEPVEPPRPWYQDPAAATLVGIGAAGLIAGGVLMGLAGGEAGTQPETVEAFRASLNREQNFWIGGATVMSVGGVLVVAGGVRWAVLAKKQKKAEVSVTPLLPGGMHVEVKF